MELIQNLKKVQDLPQDVHWFCPRHGDDDEVLYFDEDLVDSAAVKNASANPARAARLSESRERKALILDALLIFAFDGKDAAQYQEWLKENLDAQLTSCDICIREFHRGRRDLKQKLEGQYEEDEVLAFLEKFDELNVRRIVRGLSHAEKLLSVLPEEERGIGSLDSQGLYAIFESLSCEPFLKDLDLLATAFDRPFNLVQTRKRLRLSNYPPAMAHFLFQSDEDRAWWARNSWSKSRRKLTSAEFEWTVREPLHTATLRVLPEKLELDFLGAFWAGVRVIVEKLDQDLITHSLRAMEVDLFKLALDHLQVNTNHFRDLLATITHVLRVSPADFWDAMGAISPNVVIEQICHCPSLNEELKQAAKDPEKSSAELDELFAWILPFVVSLKTDNRPRACQAIVGILIGSYQKGLYKKEVKTHCVKVALRILAETLRKLNDGSILSKPNGRAIIMETMDIVEHHYQEMALATKESPELADIFSQIVRRAFHLETAYLDFQRARLDRDQPVGPGPCVFHASFWVEAAQGVRSAGIRLAKDILVGARQLSAIENIFTKQGVTKTADVVAFNGTIDAANESIRIILDRLNNFRPEDLITFFEDNETATAFVMFLLSTDMNTRQATSEMLKVMSSEFERKEAISYILSQYPGQMLASLAHTITIISSKKSFTPASALLKIGNDVLDILCNSQDGKLLTPNLDSTEARAIQDFWQALWQQLTSIFQCTEGWSMLGHEKEAMIEFCRDTMEFADRTFDHYPVFKSALKESPLFSADENSLAKRLLECPTTTMLGMVKWLRLRDEYLVSKSVTLISKLLVRLHDVGIRISHETLEYIEGVIIGKTKTTLSSQQKAELHRALEQNVGHSIRTEAEHRNARLQKKTARTLDMEGWLKSSNRTDSDSTAQESDSMSKVVADSTRSLDIYKRMQESKKLSSQFSRPVPAKAVAPLKRMDENEFKRKREQEKAEKKKRDAEAVTKIRNRAGVGALTAEQGSGLAGLGVQGKNHAIKVSSVMVDSSDESSEDSDSDEDEMTRALFGRTPKTSENVKAYHAERALKKRQAQQGPVQKKRLVRSSRDMRARLAPDLSPLHKILLGWEYFHEGDFPPKSNVEAYSSVPNSFREPDSYRRTFEPLLTLEAWQGFVKAREENTSRPYDIKVVNRSSVDAFLEISSTMAHPDARDSISEGDIVLLSKAKSPTTASNEPHCLARVYRITRKKAFLEVLYRIIPGTPLVQSLVPGADIHGMKITSIIPLEREYGALLGLEYYDLCEEIIKAKPSPLLPYSDQQIQSFIDNYGLNKAQAKAIKSAIDNDAFTLLQGPPGSGKTKTIVAIVGAILTESLRDKGRLLNVPNVQNGINNRAAAPPAPKKLLLCAPSNAAVDELVLRIKEGVKTTHGEVKKVNVVRLGRSDAINSNVQDVTLDELVNQKLNITESGTARDETQKIMKEHQQVSEKLRNIREQLDLAEAEGTKISAEVQKEFDHLRRQKALLGTKVDNAKDNENAVSRQAELNRKRAQQQIIDESHVICATLSGSGHDMFQNLNVDFETVIIDEAAQCVELSSLIPLKYGCAKCILVGDPQQLPPTVFSKQAAHFKYEQSLFVRMQTNHPKDVHLLDTQYRMHPEISVFPSQAFYDGRLLDGNDMAALRQRPWHAAPLLGPFRFFDVQGQHQSAPKGHSLVNYAEIKIALSLYRRLTTDFRNYDFKGKIGIITPYKSQLRELKEHFKRQHGPEIFESIEFNTTDAFQGRESEIIIFSCVRASPAGGIGFLQDIRRMNVGLTRAKSSLWVLGNSQSLSKGEYWKLLVDDSRSRKKFTDGNLEALLQRPSQITKRIEDGGIKEAAAMPVLNNGQSRSDLRVGNPKPASTSPINPAEFSKAVPNGFESRNRLNPTNVKMQASSMTSGSNVRPTSTQTQTATSSSSSASSSSDEDIDMPDAPAAPAPAPKSGNLKPIPAPHSNASVKPAAANNAATSTSTAAQPTAPKPNPPSGPRALMRPKKRKEIDPFIRPNKKKPRQGP